MGWPRFQSHIHWSWTSTALSSIKALVELRPSRQMTLEAKVRFYLNEHSIASRTDIHQRKRALWLQHLKVPVALNVNHRIYLILELLKYDL